MGKKEGIATVKEYGFFKTKCMLLKDEIDTYKAYKYNKDEVNDYLLKSRYGSECEECLKFTSLLEKEQFEGVCKECFKKV